MPIKKVSIKLSSMIGTAQPVYFPPVLPEEKKAKECFIVQEFAEIQKVGKYKLTDIKANPDDSNAKADVIVKCDGMEVGIQLTELKIPHRPQSSDRLRKIVDTLLELILLKIKPTHPLFVNIHSSQDYQNTSIKLMGNDAIVLAELITEAIVKKQYSPNISEYFDQSRTGLQPKPLNLPDKLKNIITRIEVSKIPDGYSTMCQGQDNLYINFNFDTVVSSIETFEYLVEEMYRKKHNSKSHILLIWSCDQDFWNEEEMITKLLRDGSENSSFEFIYYYSFVNAKGPYEANKKVVAIKERPKNISM